MKKKCRLCLNTLNNDNNCGWVFGLKYKNMYMCDIIYKTTSVEIHKLDAISQHICISCYNQVVNLYEFREKSLRNDKYLKEQYKKTLPKKTPHSSIIKIYQKYPGIKLPNTDLCLTEDISPMVVMELDRVENYFKQKQINMNKHVQCILKQERLKEKTVSKNSAMHTKDNLIQINEQDKFNYKIIKNSAVKESSKLHNLQNHRKRLSTEEILFTPKKASMDPRVSPIVIRRKSEGIIPTTTETQNVLDNLQTVNSNIEQYVLNSKPVLKDHHTEIEDNANRTTLSDNIQNKPCCSYTTPLNHPPANSKLKENQHIEKNKSLTPKNQFLINLNIVEISSGTSDTNSETSMQISQCQEDTVPLKSSNSKTVLPITTPSTSEEFGGKNVTKKRQNEHLRCRYCRCNFKTKEIYETHNKDCPIKKARKKNLRCGYCRCICTSKETYETHIKDCPIKKSKETPSDVVVQKNENLTCGYCRCILTTKEIYETHIKDCLIKKAKEISTDVVVQQIDNNKENTSCEYCRQNFLTKETYDVHLTKCFVKKAKEIPVDVVVEKLEDNKELKEKYDKVLENTKIKELVKILDDNIPTPLTTIKTEKIVLNLNLKKVPDVDPQIKIKNSISDINYTSKTLELLQKIISERQQHKQSQTDLSADNPLLKNILKTIKPTPFPSSIHKESPFYIIDNFQPYLQLYEIPININYSKQLNTSLNLIDSSLVQKKRSNQHWDDLTPIGINEKNDRNENIQPNINMDLSKVVGVSTEDLRKILDNVSPTKESINPTNLSVDDKIKLVQNFNNKTSRVVPSERDTPESTRSSTETPKSIPEQPKFTLSDADIKELATNNDFFDEWCSVVDTYNLNLCSELEKALSSENGNSNSETNKTLPQTTSTVPSEQLSSNQHNVVTQGIEKAGDSVNNHSNTNSASTITSNQHNIVTQGKERAGDSLNNHSNTNSDSTVPINQLSSNKLNVVTQGIQSSGDSVYRNYHSNTNIAPTVPSEQLSSNQHNVVNLGDSVNNHSNPNSASTVPIKQLTSNQLNVVTQGMKRAGDSIYSNNHSTVPTKQLSSNQHNVVTQGIERAGDSVNNHSNPNSASTVPIRQLSSNQLNAGTQGIERTGDSVYRNNYSNTTVPSKQSSLNERNSMTPGLEKAIDSVYRYYANTNITPTVRSEHLSSNQHNVVTQGIQRAGDSVNNHSNSNSASILHRQLSSNQHTVVTQGIERAGDSVYRMVPSVQLSSNQNNLVTQAVDSVHRNYHSNQSVIVPLTQSTSSDTSIRNFGTIPYSQHMNVTTSSVTPPRNFANVTPPMYNIRNFANVHSTSNSQCIVNNPLYTSMKRTPPNPSNTTDSPIWNRQQNQMGQTTLYAKSSIPNDNLQLIPCIRNFGSVKQVITHTPIRNQNNQMIYYTPKTSGTTTSISYNTNNIQGSSAQIQILNSTGTRNTPITPTESLRSFRNPHNSFASRQNQTVIQNTSLVRGSVPSDVSVQNFNRTQQEPARYTVGENISGSTPRSPDENIHSVSNSPTLLNSISNTIHTQEVERNKSFNQIVPSSSEEFVNIPDVDQVRYEQWFKNVNPNNELFTPNQKSQIGSFYQNTIEEFRISGKQQKPPISVKISSSAGSFCVEIPSSDFNSTGHNQEKPIVSRSSSSLRVRPLTDLQ